MVVKRRIKMVMSIGNINSIVLSRPFDKAKRCTFTKCMFNYGYKCSKSFKCMGHAAKVRDMIISSDEKKK